MAVPNCTATSPLAGHSPARGSHCFSLMSSESVASATGEKSSFVWTASLQTCHLSAASSTSRTAAAHWDARTRSIGMRSRAGGVSSGGADRAGRTHRGGRPPCTGTLRGESAPACFLTPPRRAGT
eukprot:4093509-Prymnesium_polylepis.1